MGSVLMAAAQHSIICIFLQLNYFSNGYKGFHMGIIKIWKDFENVGFVSNRQRLSSVFRSDK